MTTATLDRMTKNALIASAGISAAALLAGLVAPAGFLATLALPALAIVAGRLSAGHFAGLKQNQCLAAGAALAVLPLEAMPAVAPLAAALFLFVGLFGARFIDGMVAAFAKERLSALCGGAFLLFLGYIIAEAGLDAAPAMRMILAASGAAAFLAIGTLAAPRVARVLAKA